MVPVLADPSFHWKDGLRPPLVIAAVNVSGDPLQTGLALAVMLRVGTWLVTDMVSEFELAVDEVVQAALEVMTQVTTALLVSVEVVNVGLLVPAFVPLTFH